MRRIIIFVMLWVSVSVVLGGGAVTYVGSTVSHHYMGEYALQDAIDEANSRATTSSPITKIYFYGGDMDHRFSARGDYFELGPYINGLEMIGENSPFLNNGIKLNGRDIHIHSDKFIYIITDGYHEAIFDLGRNNTIEDIYVMNGNYGIHTDGYDATVINCIAENCIWGFVGHGPGKSASFYKVMARNVVRGMFFYASFRSTIDRATVYNFSEYGIYNESSDADLVHCARCLVYDGSGSSVVAYYQNVTFDNVYPEFNDNVAMGDNCQSRGVDFVSCAGIDRSSYDWYPRTIVLPATGEVIEFITSSADIVTKDHYYPAEWSYITYDAVPNMLCYYENIGGIHYLRGHVGYDELLKPGVARESHEYSASGVAQIHLDVSPNPFNSSIKIETDRPSNINIIDLTGKEIASFTHVQSAIWHPSTEVPAGIYLVKVSSPYGTVVKNVIYLK